MPLPAVSTTTSADVLTAADVLLVGARPGDDGPRVIAAEGLTPLVPTPRGIGFTGSLGDIARLPASNDGEASILVVGLGAEIAASRVSEAVAAGVRALGSATSVALGLGIEDEAALEGALLASYRFDEYRTAARPRLERILLVADEGPGVLERPVAVAEAVALVKDLVNTPSNDLYPETFVGIASRAAAEASLEVEVWDETRLEAEGFGGIVGVGRGSVRPPRLMRVSYAPPSATRHVALVGKGITFDSGGLSLKPASSMVGMTYDMTGAATALAVVLAAARLALPTRVTAWLCLAENMPSGSATRPGDVLRMRSGRTVEVVNTDAEGRLVLADGIAEAVAESPDGIIDIATLTGAAQTALGTRYTGVMGRGALVDELLRAASAVDEKVWRMPLPEELRSLLDSEVADCTNAHLGTPTAGMLLAAVFLADFVPEGDGAPDWVHLDIAATATNKGAPWGVTGKGPTGVMVRTLIGLLESSGPAARP